MRTAGVGVFWGDGHAWNLSRRVPADLEHTNQTAELYALLALLQQLRAHGVSVEELQVVTDSMYCINCVTKWRLDWARRGWVKADGSPLIHGALVRAIDAELRDHGGANVQMCHVRSHRPEPTPPGSREWLLWYGNRCADRLATAATRE